MPRVMNPRWVLTIPNWHPLRTNEFIYLHWTKRAKVVRAAHQIVEVYRNVCNVERANGKRRVSVFVTLMKGQRRPDVDAYWKCLLDSLVACGLLWDDSPKWCELGTVTYERGETRKTRITLEDL